jgi:hypothetical protein
MVAEIVGVRCQRHARVEQVCQWRQGVDQGGLAVIAAVAVVTDVVGPVALVGADFQMADAVSLGELARRDPFAVRQAGGHGRHGQRLPAEGVGRHGGEQGRISTTREGNDQSALPLQAVGQLAQLSPDSGWVRHVDARSR